MGRRVAAALVASLVAGACGGGAPADTPAVLLMEGRAGDQPWRLEGQRLKGKPCTFLVLPGVEQPPAGRCGTVRTELRHLEPVTLTVGTRRLVFSPLPAAARRVRIDTLDGSIRVEPARTAPGFPARFLFVGLDPSNGPVTVRVFGDGGRAVVT